MDGHGNKPPATRAGNKGNDMEGDTERDPSDKEEHDFATITYRNEQMKVVLMRIEAERYSLIPRERSEGEHGDDKDHEEDEEEERKENGDEGNERGEKGEDLRNGDCHDCNHHCPGENLNVGSSTEVSFFQLNPSLTFLSIPPFCFLIFLSHFFFSFILRFFLLYFFSSFISTSPCSPPPPPHTKNSSDFMLLPSVFGIDSRFFHNSAFLTFVLDPPILVITMGYS